MNILLVSIDSLRLDYVSQTNPSINTPVFDALTRDYCFYKGLFSTATATRPVHTSLFTGLYPFEHGIWGQSYKNMRSEIPTLFTYLQNAGIQTHGFSEVADIFTGLSYADHIKPFAINEVQRALQRPARAPKRFVFLHYWGAHTPYGASDQSALGETADLLRTGQHHIIRQRYTRAVEHIFERQLAPLLRSINLRDWAVFLFSDHGESWTSEEPYHGCTLRNSVLRVPLYYHIPGTGNPSPIRPVLSLLDLFPTLLNIASAANDYRGFGRDIRWEDDSPYKLAQIHPDPMPVDLQPPESSSFFAAPPLAGKQWALFNSEHKYSHDEGTGRGYLERIFTEDRIEADQPSHAHFQAEYERLQQSSTYVNRPMSSAADTDNDLLDQRLRDLGYLD